MTEVKNHDAHIIVTSPAHNQITFDLVTKDQIGVKTKSKYKYY